MWASKRIKKFFFLRNKAKKDQTVDAVDFRRWLRNDACQAVCTAGRVLPAEWLLATTMIRIMLSVCVCVCWYERYVVRRFEEDGVRRRWYEWVFGVVGAESNETHERKKEQNDDVRTACRWHWRQVVVVWAMVAVILRVWMVAKEEFLRVWTTKIIKTFLK